MWYDFLACKLDILKQNQKDMKTSMITTVLVAALLIVAANSASAHGRRGCYRAYYGGYYRPAPVVRYCPPVQVYAPPVVYYNEPRYCPPPPPPPCAYYARPHHYRRYWR